MYTCVGDMKEPKKEPMSPFPQMKEEPQSPEVEMKPEQWQYGEAMEIVPVENMSQVQLVQKYKQLHDEYEDLRAQMVHLLQMQSESTQDVKTTGMTLINLNVVMNNIL